MDIRIIPATARLASQIRLRKSDRRELEETSYLPPHQVLANAVIVSTRSWVAMIDGRPEITWGVAPGADEGTGTIWLLGSKRIREIPKRFHKESVVYISDMLRIYPLLYNFVDERNTLSLNWLERLGFTLCEPVPYGNNGLPFVPIYKTRS